MQATFDISLEFKGVQLDCRIPAHITLYELKGILVKVFEENHQVGLPSDWYLRLKNETFRLGEYDYLDEFPVGNGDIFKIVELGI